MSEREPEIFSPSEISWFDGWLAQDFSWQGLERFDAWQPDNAPNLKEYLWRLDRHATDDDLLRYGHLVECTGHGIFHILFVPQEWAESGLCGDLTPDELIDRQWRYWARLRADRIPDSSKLLITGAHLDKRLSASIMTGTRADFDWVRLQGDASGILQWGTRSFYACNLQGPIAVSRRIPSEHSASLYFTSCQFDGSVSFTETSGVARIEFNTCNLTAPIRIDSSWVGEVRFDGCALRSVGADETMFDKGLALATSTLEGIELTNCQLKDRLLVVDTEFQGWVFFQSCDFLGRVTLADVTWPTSTYRAVSSSGSKFFGIVDVEGDKPPPVQLFQNAEFASRVAFIGYSDRMWRDAFKNELEPRTTKSDVIVDRTTHAAAVESGCRALRKIADSEGDVQAEHVWHRAELIARRTRDDGALSEKAFSYLYEWLADYGLSILQPFGFVFGVTIVFGLLYAWLGGRSWFGVADFHSIAQGMGYSLNRTLPIGVFSDESNPWRRHLLGSGGQLRFILVRLIATAQTILSAILIYLGVMAVRRKFRIS